jgi:hypothetical protein
VGSAGPAIVSKHSMNRGFADTAITGLSAHSTALAVDKSVLGKLEK